MGGLTLGEHDPARCTPSARQRQALSAVSRPYPLTNEEAGHSEAARHPAKKAKRNSAGAASQRSGQRYGGKENQPPPRQSTSAPRATPRAASTPSQSTARKKAGAGGHSQQLSITAFMVPRTDGPSSSAQHDEVTVSRRTQSESPVKRARPVITARQYAACTRESSDQAIGAMLSGPARKPLNAVKDKDNAEGRGTDNTNVSRPPRQTDAADTTQSESTCLSPPPATWQRNVENRQHLYRLANGVPPREGDDVYTQIPGKPGQLQVRSIDRQLSYEAQKQRLAEANVKAKQAAADARRRMNASEVRPFQTRRDPLAPRHSVSAQPPKMDQLAYQDDDKTPSDHTESPDRPLQAASPAPDQGKTLPLVVTAASDELNLRLRKLLDRRDGSQAPQASTSSRNTTSDARVDRAATTPVTSVDEDVRIGASSDETASDPSTPPSSAPSSAPSMPPLIASAHQSPRTAHNPILDARTQISDSLLWSASAAGGNVKREGLSPDLGTDVQVGGPSSAPLKPSRYIQSVDFKDGLSALSQTSRAKVLAYETQFEPSFARKLISAGARRSARLGDLDDEDDPDRTFVAGVDDKPTSSKSQATGPRAQQVSLSAYAGFDVYQQGMAAKAETRKAAERHQLRLRYREDESQRELYDAREGRTEILSETEDEDDGADPDPDPDQTKVEVVDSKMEAARSAPGHVRWESPAGHKMAPLLPWSGHKGPVAESSTPQAKVVKADDVSWPPAGEMETQLLPWNDSDEHDEDGDAIAISAAGHLATAAGTDETQPLLDDDNDDDGGRGASPTRSSIGAHPNLGTDTDFPGAGAGAGAGAGSSASGSIPFEDWMFLVGRSRRSGAAAAAATEAVVPDSQAESVLTVELPFEGSVVGGSGSSGGGGGSSVSGNDIGHRSSFG